MFLDVFTIVATWASDRKKELEKEKKETHRKRVEKEDEEWKAQLNKYNGDVEMALLFW